MMRKGVFLENALRLGTGREDTFNVSEWPSPPNSDGHCLCMRVQHLSRPTGRPCATFHPLLRREVHVRLTQCELRAVLDATGTGTNSRRIFFVPCGNEEGYRRKIIGEGPLWLVRTNSAQNSFLRRGSIRTPPILTTTRVAWPRL